MQINNLFSYKKRRLFVSFRRIKLLKNEHLRVDHVISHLPPRPVNTPHRFSAEHALNPQEDLTEPRHFIPLGLGIVLQTALDDSG